MIGNIIGIATVVKIMSLGNGFKKTAADAFSDSDASKNRLLLVLWQTTVKVLKIIHLGSIVLAVGVSMLIGNVFVGFQPEQLRRRKSLIL